MKRLSVLFEAGTEFLKYYLYGLYASFGLFNHVQSSEMQMYQHYKLGNKYFLWFYMGVKLGLWH
jgi:hypothetical protein